MSKSTKHENDRNIGEYSSDPGMGKGFLAQKQWKRKMINLTSYIKIIKKPTSFKNVKMKYKVKSMLHIGKVFLTDI